MAVECYECYTCEKAFPAGWQARENHCRATGHSAPPFECDTCPRYFGSQRACNDHMNTLDHFADDSDDSYECDICDETWPSEEDLMEHEIRDHYYCDECDRTFQSYNNIRAHLNSRTHRGQEIECCFCRKRYTTATGLVHHLESGSCPMARDVDRDEIYKRVRARDPGGVITKKLIGWEGTPSYEANSRSWNGCAYECYLCHREFTTLGSLNQHLNSQAHQSSLYHCPKCRTEFKSLASFFNHLESEACGYMKFQTVQDRVGEMVRGGRLLTH